AVFSNYLGLKKKLMSIPNSKSIILDFSNSVLVDHTVLENLHGIEEDYKRNGGSFHVIGLEQMAKLSEHEFAARKRLITR
ncbi:MAG TPA: SulP family inorganic anion transporter, partial [Bacteroidia bacterium]